MKIVINDDYGGFSLSDKAIELYGEKKGIDLIKEKDSSWTMSSYYKGSIEPENFFCEREIERNDPVLIEVVESLGAAGNGAHASLKIIEIPEGVDWYIEEYDGIEWVAEKHRTWR